MFFGVFSQRASPRPKQENSLLPSLVPKAPRSQPLLYIAVYVVHLLTGVSRAEYRILDIRECKRKHVQIQRDPLTAEVGHLDHELTLFFFCHTLNPSPSAGRVRGLKGSTHLSPVHALHFDLADWVSTPAPRQLTSNKLS